MEAQVPIMVLVTLQRLCARLIRCGADMALKLRRPLKVVHVAEGNGSPGGERGIRADVLNELYALANEAGAEMCVLTADTAVTAMAEYAREHNAGRILMGAGERAQKIAGALRELLPGVQVMIVEAELE
jgi:K+-sensing histidine kinase KdpD